MNQDEESVVASAFALVTLAPVHPVVAQVTVDSAIPPPALEPLNVLLPFLEPEATANATPETSLKLT
ncbi:MAG: hypothetical protein WA142_01080, partial [Rugosibacter sp.]